MKYFLLSAFLITLFVVGFTMRLEYQVSHATGSNMEVQTFTVAPGVGVLALGSALEEKNIIASQYAFAWAVATKRLSYKLIAGDYEISGKQSIEEILTLFTTGKVVSHDVKVTFPEGWTMDMMAERLTANGLPGAEFLKETTAPASTWKAEYVFLKDIPQGRGLEGFLFPDTYRFAKDVTANQIIDTLLANFQTRVYKKFEADAVAKHQSFYKTLILASIVEEEGNTAENRGMIADIFWKRIAVGQPLQSDVTVNYASGIHKQKLSLEDIDIDSHYNTYKYPGLPPTPISNPGLESMQAAVYPTPNDYLYFITDPKTNGAYYARTFDEHIQNRRAHGL